MSDLQSVVPDIAPTGALGIVLVLIGYIVREWRIGRQADVEHFKQRARDAEAERDRAYTEHQRDRSELVGRVSALEREVRGLRTDHDRYIQSLSDRHREELRKLNRRLDTELRVQYRLREHMATHGLPLPADLDPGRPDVPTDLGPAAHGPAEPPEEIP
ncbi:MAG: hypothetical protein ACTHQ3_15710 [Motilibacteraceae bacterium]